MGNLDRPKTDQSPVSECLTSKAQHDWVPTKHGPSICRRCFLNAGQAADLGLRDLCAPDETPAQRLERVRGYIETFRVLPPSISPAESAALEALAAAEQERDHWLKEAQRILRAGQDALEERDRLRAALEPFAKAAGTKGVKGLPDRAGVAGYVEKGNTWLATVGDLRRAAAALPTTGPAPCGPSGETER